MNTAARDGLAASEAASRFPRAQSLRARGPRTLKTLVQHLPRRPSAFPFPRPAAFPFPRSSPFLFPRVGLPRVPGGVALGLGRTALFGAGRRPMRAMAVPGVPDSPSE